MRRARDGAADQCTGRPLLSGDSLLSPPRRDGGLGFGGADAFEGFSGDILQTKVHLCGPDRFVGLPRLNYNIGVNKLNNVPLLLPQPLERRFPNQLRQHRDVRRGRPVCGERGDAGADEVIRRLDAAPGAQRAVLFERLRRAQ
jgi:hypothetical protein